MPELPDINAYLDALRSRVVGHVLERVRVATPFLLRSVDPPLTAAAGRRVEGLRRLGKRIIFALEDDLFLILHLMIAGRLRWYERGPAPTKLPRPSVGEAALPLAVNPSGLTRGKAGLAAFDFSSGTLVLTEAGTRKRASLYLVRGEGALAEHDPGGLEVLDASREAFQAALQRERHTLKRALTDPRLFSGIGNAYSDEILHRARLSPVQWTSRLTPDEVARLYAAARATLQEWIDRLRAQTGGGFPEKVTAFRPEMAVHGRYGRPCPDCGAPVQRIAYADNETNYCAACQTGGRLLADRSLSRLLKEDWPRSLADLEELKRRRSAEAADAPPPRDTGGRVPPASSAPAAGRSGPPRGRGGSGRA